MVAHRLKERNASRESTNIPTKLQNHQQQLLYIQKYQILSSFPRSAYAAAAVAGTVAATIGIIKMYSEVRRGHGFDTRIRSPYSTVLWGFKSPKGAIAHKSSRRNRIEQRCEQTTKESKYSINSSLHSKCIMIFLIFITSDRRAEEGREMQVVRTSTYVPYSTYLSFQVREFKTLLNK